MKWSKDGFASLPHSFEGWEEYDNFVFYVRNSTMGAVRHKMRAWADRNDPTVVRAAAHKDVFQTANDLAAEYFGNSS